MTLYEYIILPEAEQLNAVWQSGNHIDVFINSNITINLYAINDFFVEIYYDADLNKIIDKKHFKQGELLEKYLRKINL